MKLEAIASNVTVEGDIARNSVGIDVDNLGFILTIISTKLYSKPIESFIREITSNAWDSHIEAGTKDPVIINLNHSITNPNKIQVTIQDFGVGLSPERFEKVFKKAGSSTKRDSNDQIGGYGIGRFSAIAVSDMVHIISNHNGKKYTYLMYKDGNDINIDLALEADTTEENGLTYMVDIDTKDWHNLRAGILNQLRFFDNVFIQGDYYPGFVEEFNKIKIKAYKNFLVSTQTPATPGQYILLGKVAYPLQVNELLTFVESPEEREVVSNITKINNRISVKFGIGELQVTPNREQLLYDNDTVRKIINKFTEFFKELKELKKEALTKVLTFSQLKEELSSSEYRVESGDGYLETFGLHYEEPITINGITFKNYRLIKSDVDKWFQMKFLTPYYNVSMWRGLTRNKDLITLNTFLQLGICIPEKLTMISREYLKRNYEDMLLGRWENLNLGERMVKQYKHLLKHYDKAVVKSFIIECVSIWNAKSHFTEDKIPESFRKIHKPVRDYRGERNYIVNTFSNYGSRMDRYSYKKEQLPKLPRNNDALTNEIVVVDSMDSYYKQYTSSIRKLIQKHVTVITAAPGTVKILKTHYSTLDTWLDKNKHTLKESMEKFSKYVIYRDSKIDVNNLIEVEKITGVKTHVSTSEYSKLRSEFQYLEFSKDEVSIFGDVTPDVKLEATLKHPNLLKLQEVIRHFPTVASKSVQTFYSEAILQYLKKEKIINTDNTIIYS